MLMMTWNKKSHSIFSMIVALSLLALAACSGGGGGGIIPGATPPFIFAALSSFPTNSVPAGFNTGASVLIKNTSGGTDLANATVTMNGTSLPYNILSQDYVGDVIVSPGSLVTVTANIGGITYSASGPQFSTYPEISSPSSNSTWSVNSSIPVMWSGGTPTQNAVAYGIGVLDASNPNGMLAWPAGFDLKQESIGNPSDTIPAGSLAPGSYFVIACIVGNAVAIPNATADSLLAFAGCNYVPITVH